MGGSTKTVSTAPKETAPLRQGLQNWLMGGQNQTMGQWAGRPGSQNMPPWMQGMGGPGMNAAGVQYGGPQAGGGSPFDRVFTQSADQMGGTQSPFFQNMMAQYQPMFDQQRREAMAAGREGAGNMTGSGFANIFGQQMNRSLGQQQAMTGDLFNQIMQMEMQRQQGDAGRFAQLLGGMGMAGLGPDQIVQSGGIGAALAPIGMGIGSAMGGPLGTALAGQIGGLFGGGGSRGVSKDSPFFIPR